MGTCCDSLIAYSEWYDRERPQSWHAEERDLSKAELVLAECVEEQVVESPESEFRKLVDAWRNETQNISSITKTISHRAYQRIIDLGEPVIGLILQDFAINRAYWATALHAITGQNPVAAEHLGNPQKVREDWLKWGKNHGYRLPDSK